MEKIPHRLDNIDYRDRRVYHITMTTVDRRPLLGCVVGDPALPPTEYDAPRIFLSPLGRAVERCLHTIPTLYENTRILAYQLMPDHLHLVLFITESSNTHLGLIIRGFKQGCNKAARELAAESAAPIFVPVFSPGYYETPLSGRDQLRHMIDYVKDNPRRLLIKRQHSTLFRPVPLPASLLSASSSSSSVVPGSAISSQNESPSQHPLSPLAIGNTALLSAPLRIAVRISRRISPATLQSALARIMEAANDGAVIISPCISPGEVAVRDALLAARLPYIRIDGEGFGPYYKPSGYEIAAVAAARLLLIAPWPYNPRRIRLTKTDFEAMNAMAAQLSTVQWNFAPEH